jgi:hypothetical protein
VAWGTVARVPGGWPPWPTDRSRRLEVVAALAVEGQIEAVALVALVDAQADQAAHHAGDQPGPDRGEGDRDPDADHLLAELRERAVDHPGRRREAEHPDQEGADQATDAVDPEGVEGVVDAEPGLVLDRGEARHRRQRADHQRRPRRDVTRARRDRDQPGDDARGHAHRGRLAVAPALDDHPGQRRRRRRGLGGGEGQAGRRARHRALDRDRRAGVEPEPAEPQEPGAGQGHGEVVGQDRGAAGRAVVPARADHARQDQRAHPRRDVDHGAAGEVEDAVRVEPTALGPHPVSQRAVDKRHPQRDEHQVAAQAHPLGERPRDQGRRDDRELALEHHEHQLGDALVAEHRRVVEAGQADQRRVPADQPALAVAEGQAVADHHPLHADHRHRQKRVHHRRQHVLAADHAAVEQGQAGHHQEHERGADQHPRGGAGVDRRGGVHRADGTRLELPVV